MGHLLNLFLSVFEVLFVVQASSIATDTLASTQSLSDDGSSLVSNNGRFEFGFFSPGSSKSRYLGLWYKNISQQTVVWVANRASPIADLSGRLMIDKAAGKLVIVNKNGTFQVWSSSSLRSTEAPILQLLNSGNLVLRDAKVEPSVSSSYLWQSFDYPSDTLLPEMKLGWDLKAGREWTITSWKNATDPSPGELVLRLENPYPEWYILKGAKKLTRGGPWNGLRYSGLPQLKANRIYTVDFVMNESGTYCIDHLTANSSATMRLVLNETVSQLVRYTWDAAQGSWQTLRSYPADPCDSYGSCGPYGICSSVDAPMCQCLEGFEPKVPDRWGAMDWSDGCVRMEPLNCSRKAEFRKFKGLKLPDTSNSWLNRSMNLKECATKCSSSCSCMAYTNSDIRGAGSGCATWTGDLLDMKLLAPGGQDLYIRMQFLEPDYNHILQIILPVSLSTLGFLLIIGYCIWKRRRRLTKNDRNIVNENELELPVLRLATIVKATCNFSPENKLGEGGFGPVYKGIRDDGQEIAVKKLSQTSFQGQIEFKNELILIAKLQHRNLVKLLGCCIEGSEKMLIYEYMPNRSLDHYIFDHTEGNLMSWVDCFRIISGIARGLLYLHQDSRLRIVHRDLKASNILLDDKMNPKISDFGLAKIFGGDQTEGRTKRVVGTHGYMAPEYMIHGRFSMKSDVFSFGVLVLELVTGKRNGGLVHHDCHLNLIGQAWALWQEGRPQNLMEGSSLESYDLVEVIRCIHIGLLCVQRHPDDRPSMSSVVLMLGSDSHHLPQPKQPAFITDQNVLDGKNLPSPGKYSTNEVTMTQLLEGR